METKSLDFLVISISSKKNISSYENNHSFVMLEYFGHCAMAGRLGKQILRNTGKCHGQPKLIYATLYIFCTAKIQFFAQDLEYFIMSLFFDKPPGNFVYECQDVRTF